MQQSFTQAPEQKANQAAASLAFATHLSTQMMQHQNPPLAPQEPQNAPGQEEIPETAPEPQENKAIEDLISKVEDLKKEIDKTSMRSEVESIRKELEALLTEDDGQ